ncbi:MAG: UvrD-helicase domain-containing protein [Planctomycetota bacterium]
MIDKLLDGLTEEQRRAVTATDRGLCVSAGAGSGKTRILVLRFAYLVLARKADVSRILAITFTEKAAAEMKQRIAKCFADVGRDDLRQNVEFAYVSTIHAFARRLLAENAIDAGVDPHFAVLEEFHSPELAREVLDETLARWRTERPDDYARLTEDLLTSTPSATGGGFAFDLMDLYERIRCAAAPPESWRPHETNPREAAKLLARLTDVLSAAAAFADDATLTSAARLRLDRVLERAQAARTAAAGDFSPDAVSALAALAKAIDLRAGTADFKARLSELRQVVNGVLSLAVEKLSRPTLELLGDLLRDFDRDFSERKRRSGLLDFNDLILRSMTLLETNAALRARLADKFAFVLVDEFQDTDPSQKRLIDALTRPERLFVVGDVKQSIYGFRNADVRVFIEHQDRAPETGTEVIPLPCNWRSRADLLDAINHVFRSIWTGADRQTPFEALVAARAHAPRSVPPVELLVSRDQDVPSARRREAHEIARRIREIVDNKELAVSRKDSKDFGTPLRYRDFAILLAATTDVNTYERALESRGVPYHSVSGRGFWRTREVTDCIRALEVIANPRDEIALACVLRGPLVGASDAALLLLKEHPAARAGLLWDALGELDEIDLPEDDRRRLERFRADFAALRADASRMTLYELLSELSRRTDFPLRTLLSSGGPRRFANLRRVLSLARDTDAANFFDLREFVAALRVYRTTETRRSEAPTGSETDDVVKIMTIHAAKGLEFGAVVVADLARGPNQRSAPLLFSPERGLAGASASAFETAGNFKGLAQETLARELAQREEEERLRLLYVAMTRAKEYLILSAALGARKTHGEQVWLDELSRALGVDFRTPEPPAEPLTLDSHARCAFFDGPPPNPETTRRTNLAARYREDLLAGRFPALDPANAGPFAEAADVLARIDRATAAPPPSRARVFYSVTELLEWRRCPRCHYYAHVLRLPEELLARDQSGPPQGPSAAALGEAVHAAIVRWGSSKTREDLRAVVQRELALRDIDPATCGKDLDALMSGIAAFFGSDLWRAMEASALLAWEEPFVLRHGEANFRGQVDLYCVNDGRVTLVDFKTSRLSPKDAPKRALDYALQLGVYAQALRAVHRAKEVRAFCAFLHPAAWVPLVLEKLNVPEILCDFIAAQDGAAGEPRRGPSCASCAFRRLCAS